MSNEIKLNVSIMTTVMAQSFIVVFFFHSIFIYLFVVKGKRAFKEKNSKVSLFHRKLIGGRGGETVCVSPRQHQRFHFLTVSGHLIQ